MSDIVERLRGAPPTNSTLDRYEAADTIEALRAENARLRDALKETLEIARRNEAGDYIQRALKAMGETE